MAGGGLDDELLELAGGSARQIDLSDSDDDRVRSGSKRDASSSKPTSSSLAKKRRLDLLDESDSGSDRDAPGSDVDNASEDEEIKNPYPYQGIYKSARDMEELMGMNELEREDILARRRDEVNRRKQKFELAAMVKAQKAAAGATRKAVKKTTRRVVRGSGSSKKKRRGSDSDDLTEESEDEDEEEEEEDGDSDFAYGGAASAAKSRKKKMPGQTDAKSAKLSELRKKRQQKAAGISRGAGSDDEDASKDRRSRRGGYASSDSDDDGGVGYSDTDDEIYSRRPKKSSSSRREDDSSPSSLPSLSDLNAARISRDRVEQRLYAPRWKDALIGSFIRFSWGMRRREDGRGDEEIYRIHQITDVLEKPGKFYDLSEDRSGKWCNVYLAFEHNGHEHEAKLTMLSRRDFSESERDRWVAWLKGNKQKVPKASSVANKADQLEKFFTSPLTEADIGKMLEQKKRIRAEAVSVMGGSAASGGALDSPRPASTPGMATPILASSADVAPQSLEARLAAVNERNRAQDRIKMSDVERKARNNKIAQLQAQAAARKQEEEQKAQADTNGEEGEGQKLELTHEKPGMSGMGNGFVAVKNFATTVEVDLGDF